MCDGVERCCGMHVRGVMCCRIECGRCMREGLECLELTRWFTATHVCDCGVVWRLMVLGKEQLRAGAREFCGEGRMGEREVGVSEFEMWL